MWPNAFGIFWTHVLGIALNIYLGRNQRESFKNMEDIIDNKNNLLEFTSEYDTELIFYRFDQFSNREFIKTK